MSRECRLTTFDNPFDPFDQFDDWLQFDNDNNYNCCSRLARIAQLTDDLSEAEVDEEIERAIDEIIFFDAANLYKKVIRERQTT